jgi:hypothetical protein
VVLVDHAAKHLAAPRRRAEAHNRWFVMVGWPLVPGLVRPVPVVVPGVGPQHGPQMGFAVDQHPVGALGPYGRYPPFRIAVRPGRLRRDLHDPHALAGEDIIERSGELGAPVADEEPERADPVCEVHDQVAAC